MYFLYNILILIAGFALKIAALFNKKIKLFIDGRKQTFFKLQQAIDESDEVIWIHCASLGEFEQGRPIIEKLKLKFPTKKVVITFFSPSGYEVRKNYEFADVVCYLPLDSVQNAKRFLKIVHPQLAIFVKYEFWPNLLKELKIRNIETLLISGIFRENQSFFNWYGGWIRKSLTTFSHFFVQDENSKQLLNSINFNNVTISGDTRFDRVFEITQQNNKLPFIEEFIDNKYTLVAGSTWKEDETMLVDYINNKASENEKFIIAPHNINANDIADLKNSFSKKVVLFSEKPFDYAQGGKNLADYQIFIINTVGILTKIYSYANIAYVGGGFTKTGVHNVLEPATFGIPILIGPNYHKFNEAIDLVKNKACFVIDDFKELSLHLERFYQLEELRLKTGECAKKYVADKTGATAKILEFIAK
ncbi:MAG: 3-deoxy-D-manno-octulosonic acid transferase [Flavobacteria bacterium RIFCSPLOWO2_12_FULL_35_11]|nr:MAG: 3-deoxy-D-manno-octulosonic acid transferase [Flavobacteria bacterium RIFCSPLOWO2_12_FULL_35_11]